MAYLQGGTLVDGNLYVEGGLRVKRVTDSSGKPLPHLYDADSSIKNCLIKFMDSDGAIHRSSISEDNSTGIPVYSILKNKDSINTDKIQFKLEDNSVMELEIKADGLYVSLNPGKGKGAKQFVLKPDAYIIPYSAKEIEVVSSTLKGVNKSGEEVGPGEVPDHFEY